MTPNTANPVTQAVEVPVTEHPDVIAGAPHLIALREVGKHYGNVIALSGITMDVDAGRVTASSVTTVPGSPR
jgi:simple sugar transport system ATP-binding protein